jgi:hypothetical protein
VPATIQTRCHRRNRSRPVASSACGPGRVGVDELEGDLTGETDPLAVAPQGGEAQVVAALLTFAHERALAPQVEVDLGQLEAVGGADERLEASFAVGGGGVADEAAVRHVRATADAPAQLVQLREAEA